MTKAIASSTIPAKLLLGRKAVDRIEEVEIIEEFKTHNPSCEEATCRLEGTH